jgi:hypothetical protein
MLDARLYQRTLQVRDAIEKGLMERVREVFFHGGEDVGKGTHRSTYPLGSVVVDEGEELFIAMKRFDLESMGLEVDLERPGYNVLACEAEGFEVLYSGGEDVVSCYLVVTDGDSFAVVTEDLTKNGGVSIGRTGYDILEVGGRDVTVDLKSSFERGEEYMFGAKYLGEDALLRL